MTVALCDVDDTDLWYIALQLVQRASSLRLHGSAGLDAGDRINYVDVTCVVRVASAT